MTYDPKFVILPDQEEVGLTDEQILTIAKDPTTAPVWPLWLRDDVIAGDVQKRAILFARAVIEAYKESL